MKRTSALRRKPAREAGPRAIDFDELPGYVGYQVRRVRVLSQYYEHRELP